MKATAWSHWSLEMNNWKGHRKWGVTHPHDMGNYVQCFHLHGEISDCNVIILTILQNQILADDKELD